MAWCWTTDVVFDMDEVKLYLGDCLEIMKTMSDKSVDLVLTDPPYGINVQRVNCVANRHDKRTRKLKPCPFCGSKKVSVNNYFGEYSAGCDNCFIETQSYKNEKEAIKKWNRRNNA